MMNALFKLIDWYIMTKRKYARILPFILMMEKGEEKFFDGLTIKQVCQSTRSAKIRYPSRDYMSRTVEGGVIVLRVEWPQYSFKS